MDAFRKETVNNQVCWHNVEFIDVYTRECYLHGNYTLNAPKCRENTPSANRKALRLYINWGLN